MKHDIIQADINKGKINFIFECKYFLILINYKIRK